MTLIIGVYFDCLLATCSPGLLWRMAIEEICCVVTLTWNAQVLVLDTCPGAQWRWTDCRFGVDWWRSWHSPSSASVSGVRCWRHLVKGFGRFVCCRSYNVPDVCYSGVILSSFAIGNRHASKLTSLLVIETILKDSVNWLFCQWHYFFLISTIWKCYMEFSLETKSCWVHIMYSGSDIHQKSIWSKSNIIFKFNMFLIYMAVIQKSF